MRTLISLIAGAGDWLVSLSDRAKVQLVLAALFLLIGGGIFKLIVSIDQLNKPLPAASPAQLIKPMEQLFEQAQDNVTNYQQSRQRDMNRLDSLAKAYPDKKLSPQ